MRRLLFGVAVCALAFGAILVLAYGFPAARELDAKALQGFLGFQRPAVNGIMRAIGHVGDPPVVGFATVVLAAIALLRGRPRVALAVIALLAATSVSSQVLKAVLAYPRFPGQAGLARIEPAAFPSGHSTAVMSLAIAGVLVVPARMRPFAAVVGAGLALAVGMSVISLGWHFASDVAGGFLLATGWGLAVVAALRAAALRWPERTLRGQMAPGLRRAAETVAGAGLTAMALVGLAVVAGVALLALTSTDLGLLVREHTAALLVAAGLVLLAVALVAGFVAGLRQSGPQ